MGATDEGKTVKQPPPLWHDADYVYGQIAGLQHLILAVAQTMPKAQFRKQGLARIDAARTAMLSMPLAENALLALDHLEGWLREVTG